MTVASGEQWRVDAGAFGAPVVAVDAAHDDLVRRYEAPGRHHHGLAHVASVLRTVDELLADLGGAGPGAAADPGDLHLAAWFHDAVYDATRHDNEAASAELAARVLTGLGAPRSTVDEVVRLVLLTAGHEVADDDAPGAVLVDADLAILGAPRPTYARYADGVRAEYAHVPDDAFRAGRAAVLRDLLARPTIFRTAPGRIRFEASARTNLTAELVDLTGEAAEVAGADGRDGRDGEPPAGAGRVGS